MISAPTRRVDTVIMRPFPLRGRNPRLVVATACVALLVGSCDVLPEELPDVFPDARIGDAPAERPEEAISVLVPRRQANPDRGSVRWITGEALAAERIPALTETVGTVDIDRRATVLPVAAGISTTTQPADLDSGGMSLTGSVVDEEGEPIAGATIRLERVVGDLVQPAEVRANNEGRFEARGLIGGRYRVRAFRQPDKAMLQAAAFFLEDGIEHDVEIPVETLSGIRATVVTAPSVVRVGDQADVWIRISRATVDAQGVVATTPQAGVRVALPSDARWEYTPGAVVGDDGRREAVDSVTNATGDVLWTPTCRQAGESSAVARVRQIVRQSGATQPGTPPPPPTSVLVDAVFTPPVCHPPIPTPVFPIGSSVRPPSDRQFPGGVYRLSPAVAGERCAVSYEAWGTVNWSGTRTRVDGNDRFLVGYPIRALRPEALPQPGDPPPATSLDEAGNPIQGPAAGRVASCTLERVD